MAPPASKKTKKETGGDKPPARKPRAKKALATPTVGTVAIAAQPPTSPVVRNKKDPTSSKVANSKPPPERIPRKKKQAQDLSPTKQHSSSPSRELPVAAPSVVSPSVAANGLVPPPVTNLAAFGLVHADAPHAKAVDSRNSTIHCAVVEGLLNWFLFFYIQSLSIANPNNSWAEKLLSDALKNRLAWIIAMGICERTYHLHVRDVPMKNSKGYFVRVFLICTQGPRPSRDTLLNLGNHICSQLNAIKGNDTTTSLVEESYFWLGDDVVWADIVGSDEA